MYSSDDYDEWSSLLAKFRTGEFEEDEYFDEINEQLLQRFPLPIDDLGNAAKKRNFRVTETVKKSLAVHEKLGLTSSKLAIVAICDTLRDQPGLTERHSLTMDGVVQRFYATLKRRVRELRIRLEVSGVLG